MRNRPELEFCGRDYLVTKELDSDFQTWLDRTSVFEQDTEVPSGLAPIDLERAKTEWLQLRIDENNNGDAEQRRNEVFVPLGNAAVPYKDFEDVAKVTHPDDIPRSATGFYMELAAERYFSGAFLLSSFAVLLVIVALYFLGRFVSAKVGGWFVRQFEDNLLARLPVIRNVYSSAKQVTEFLFTENQVEYRRVVAIEYPRRGIWSLALVTGEGMLDITTAVGEPCVSVLIPSSPMPVTGYTISVPRSQIMDLNISVDQAFQFCISCGVLVPPNQKVTPELLQERLTRRLAEELSDDATLRRRDGVTDQDLPVSEGTGDEFSEPPGNGPKQ